MPQLWPAPSAPGPVHSTVAVPGSKSITNRALVIAALADGPSTLRAPLRSRDTELMADALRALGTIIEDGPQGWQVTPGTLHETRNVDCGLAGTVMRFVPPLAAMARGTVRFDGDPQARQRPLDAMLNALRGLGAEIAGNTLPFEVHGTGHLAGGEVTIDASATSQFVSGLLLAGARCTRGITITHVGEPVPSTPHIEMTVAMLRDAGVEVNDQETDRWSVEHGAIRPLSLTIEPDLSNATPFLAAAAVTGGAVTVPRWPAHTTQAGDGIRGILMRMGANVTHNATGLTVTGPDQLKPIDIDLHSIGELTPTVAALAALAEGTSTLRGIAHLRGHETDRLAALERELNALGGNVTQTADGLRVEGRPLTGGTWQSYADHRMATAGAILGLRVPSIHVENIETTNKTLPDFARMWETMLSGER